MSSSKAILGNSTRDNVFIIFPAFVGLSYLAIYVFLTDVFKLDDFIVGLVLILIFSIFFDIHHYFSTYLKVFLDKHYFKQNKAWLLSSTLFIIVVSVLAYYLVAYDSHSYQGYLYVFFLRRFLIVLGFYHSIKQNWGFMAIYKRYEGEPQYKINWELIAFASASFIALIIFSIQNPLWFPATEHYLFAPEEQYQPYITALWHQLALYNFLFAIGFMLIALSSKWFQIKGPAKSMAQYCFLVAVFIYSSLHFGVNTVLYATLAVLVVVFVVSFLQAVRLQRKLPSINKRKWQIFAMSLLLYYGVLLYPLEGDQLIKLGAITIPHNIQYLFFVPHFMKKKLAESKHNHGLAKTLLNRTLSFIIIGLVFSAVFESFRVGNHFFMPAGWAMVQNTVAVFFIAVVLHHYYLDAVIWKFNKQESLAKII